MASHYTIGLHYGHDSTIVLIKDGVIIEAMSEERLSRMKKHEGFPHASLAYLRNKYKDLRIDHVCVVGSTMHDGGSIFVGLDENIQARKNPVRVRHYLRSLGFRFPLMGKLFKARDTFLGMRTKDIGDSVREYIAEQFPGATCSYIHHHDAHAWATVPFMPDHRKRLIFTLDGAGDDASGSVSIYEHGSLRVLERFAIPDSLGLLYCAIVDVLGMKRNEHEFKVMGLAPYAKVSSGEKVYHTLKHILYFDPTDMKIKATIPTDQATAYLIAHEFTINYRFDSLAYGIQKLTEEVLKDLVRAYIQEYDIHDIAIGGGVFMNVKANQKVLEMPEVSTMISTPSCGDESLAIGAAISEYIKTHGVGRVHQQHDIYWGSEYSDEEIKKTLDTYPFTKQCTLTYFDPKGPQSIEQEIARILANNSVVGRLCGRAEWGARALGNRSILANPSSRDNVKLINEMIKNRDFWMPFATSILAEDRDEYLIIKKEVNAPYMSITFETTERAWRELPAALHPYDLTSRPQIVKKEQNPKYHALISEFKKLTGIGGVLNTSFNLHGEPNVETPLDALKTFEHSGLPYLAIGNYLLGKRA